MYRQHVTSYNHIKFNHIVIWCMSCMLLRQWYDFLVIKHLFIFSWYHGPMNRLEAEKTLYGQGEGSYLVRGKKGSYALSIKYVHLSIMPVNIIYYIT